MTIDGVATLVTGNQGKLREFEQILGVKLTNLKLNLVEIQDVKVINVIKYKLQHAKKYVDGPVIVEDTGLEIGFMNRLPGALIKHFMDRLGDYGIAAINGTSPATAITVIGYFDGNNDHYFTGSVTGHIAEKPRGTNGFGWDTIFIPDNQEGGSTKTFAEMNDIEKNSCSMRRFAINQLIPFLNPDKHHSNLVNLYIKGDR